MMAGYDLPLRAIREQIASALDLVIQIERMNDGARRVVAITEVQRMESEVITLQDLFMFQVDAVAATKHVVGFLKPTGLRPTFLEKFDHRGIEIPAGSGPTGSRATSPRSTAVTSSARVLGLRAATLTVGLALLLLLPSPANPEAWRCVPPGNDQ